MKDVDEYISRKAILRMVGHRPTTPTTDREDWLISAFISTIEKFPASDVVARDCFDRILAQNDDMRAMLAQIGKKPGDSMEDMRRVVFCRDCVHAWRYTNKIKCGYWSEQTTSEIVCEDDFCSYGEKREES